MYTFCMCNLIFVAVMFIERFETMN